MLINTPNIILISIDTLRADHLSCYGYHKLTTPNIDELAKESTIYRENYSTGVWTPPVHASIFTGLYISEHGVYGSRKLAREVPTIAEILRDNGYQTGGFVNNSQVGELVGFERGHDTFFEVWKGIRPKSISARWLKGIRRKIRQKLGVEDMGANRTNKLFMHWVEHQTDNKKPFYAFIHYIEPHNPLNPPLPYKNKYIDKKSPNLDMKNIKKVAHNPLICYVEDLRLNDDEKAYIKSLYDGEVGYIDSKIGEIIDFLKEKKLYNNSMILITSDHGEHFGEYGLWSHVASLHKEILHVPLIIKFPNKYGKEAEVIEYTQIVDIFPTVMEIAGISDLHYYESSGVSLANDRSQLNQYRDFIIAEWEGRIPYFIKNMIQTNKKSFDLEKFKIQMAMIQDKQFKYLWKSTGSEKFYDISKGKEEKIDHEANYALVKRLKNKLFNVIKRLDSQTQSIDEEIDEEVAKNLRSLGYL